MQVRRTPSSRYHAPATQPLLNDRTQLSPKSTQLSRLPPMLAEPASNGRSPGVEHSRMRSQNENTPSNNNREASFSFERDQSKLCFSNLKNSIRPNQARMCQMHPSKKAKYRDRQYQKLYCFHCAIQVASQGYQLEELETQEPFDGDSSQRQLTALVEDCMRRVLESKVHLQEEYRVCREAMLRDMEAHRCYYDLILERISDMRNRDMAAFEEALLQAEKQLVVVVDDLTKNNYNVLSGINRKQHSREDITRLCTKSLQMAQSVSNHKLSTIRQDVKLNQKLQDIDRVMLSLRLNVRGPSTGTSVLSQILKSNSTFSSDKQRKDRDEKPKSIQDTPESIKNKLSMCKSIVDPKEVRMLGQIDFCQSLVGGGQTIGSNVGASGVGSNNSTSTAKARSRYNIADDH